MAQCQRDLAELQEHEATALSDLQACQIKKTELQHETQMLHHP